MARNSRKRTNRVVAWVASIALVAGLVPIPALAFAEEAGETGPDAPAAVGAAEGGSQPEAAPAPDAAAAVPQVAEPAAPDAGAEAVPAEGEQAVAGDGAGGEPGGVQAADPAVAGDEGVVNADEPEEAEGAEDASKAEGEDGEEDAEADKDKKTEYPAFKQSKTVDGVTVTVEADEGAFPAGADLSVASAPASATEAAVAAERDANQNVATSYTFDVKVLDKDGEELQPKDGKSVRVSFAAAEVADPNLDVSVYHVSDGAAEELPVSESGSIATARSTGFSYYTVEFTYGELQYVLSGGESVRLAEILEKVGLTGTATAVQCSDESLFSASVANGEWTVTSHRAFSTKEWMKVTINGVVYEITVTDDVQGDWEYTVIDGEATIIDYKAKGSSQEVTIPDKLGGYPVVAIGNNAFRASHLTGVTIPDGVESIGENAFDYCNDLKSVTIGNGVKTIGQEAFRDCKNLVNLTIGNGVTTIGQSAFENCNSLPEVTIPGSVSSLGSRALYISNSGTHIYFDGTHERWDQILGPKAIRSDCATVHYSCGDGVYYTLDDNGNLDISKKGNGTGAISAEALKREEGITTVVIEDGVTSIGNSAFAGCADLASVEIPPSVTSIGEEAFDGCAKLTSVTIGSDETNPCSLTSIGENAFRSIGNVATIAIYTYKGAVGQDESSWSGDNAVDWKWAQVTGTPAPTAGGEVAIAGGTSTGTGMIFKTGSGSECTLTATTNEGYVFANWTWTENGDVQESADNPLKFAPTADRTLTANFAKQLTVTVNDQTYVYDGGIQGPGDADYDNPDDIKRMVNVDGLMDGDKLVSIEVDGQSDTADAKVYSDVLVPGAARIFNASSKDVTDQYDITYVKGDIVIEPAEAIVTTGSATKVYDGKALTDDGVSIKGLVNGETATATATGSQTEVGSSPNTYSIDWGATDAKNYSVTEKLGTLTVAQKPVTITVDSASKVQGETDPAFTGKVEGLVKDGDLGAISYKRTNSDEAPGTYEGVITATYTANPNYDVTVTNGDFTITTAPAKPVYRVVSGAGGTWTEGSGATLPFTVKRSVDDETTFGHFTGIQVDGKAVPQKDASGKDNWTARSGSVVVELQPSYLSTLTVGKHALAATFDDGDPAAADFTVAAQPAAKHTVTFDANGHGTAPAAQQVEDGKRATRPANPTASGWTFGGWYTDKACTRAYDFSTPVTEDITLYAKWTQRASTASRPSSGTTARTGDELPSVVPITLALAVASGLALAGFSLRRCGTRATCGRHARR